MSDPREPVYEDLHDWFDRDEGPNRHSAELILSLLFEHYRPRSVVDVGCGIGTWLDVARGMGIQDLAGVEGAWLDRSRARVAPEVIRTLDLEQPFDLGRRFELAVSLEVAEHLSEAAAAGFVAALVRHSDVILFSAAIPFQGGAHHVNEQFPDYWEALFAAHGYVALDFIRPQIWYAADVLIWLRQNTVVYAREALAEGKGPFAGVTKGGPLAIVHPELYTARIESVLREHRALLDQLAAGKVLFAERGPDGKLAVRSRDGGG